MEQFPKKTTAYVTILREPFAQFKSTISFFEELSPLFPKFTKTRRYIGYLEEPSKYERKIRFTFNGVYHGAKSLTRNFMSTELGFPLGMSENKTAINLFIHQTSIDFDLVMIAEYLPESLVLLKRLMNWSLRDILHANLNRNTEKERLQTARPPVDKLAEERLLEKHRNHSAADHQLYKYFNQTLWSKIRKQGPDFLEEVQIFKQLLRGVSVFCTSCSGTFVQEPKVTLPHTKFSPSFDFSVRDCEDLNRMPEFYTKVVWKKNPEVRRRNYAKQK
jgi:hypothetical protein